MIVGYLNQKQLTAEVVTFDNRSVLKEAIWVDLLSISKPEEKWIEETLNIDVPTREEMREIELSSRLYKDEGVLYMTGAMIAQSDSDEPKLDSITFVLTQDQLITVRYIEPQAFKLFNTFIKKMDPAHRDACSLLIELLDAAIDRLADILEMVAGRLEEYSKNIFTMKKKKGSLDYLELLQKVGMNGDLTTKTRESLVSFSRLITYFSQTASARIDNVKEVRLSSLSKDVIALSDHANFLSNKVNFLLDATLGMVSIEQNNIIKIFSVAAVIFLPPTLVASIYGMNFKVMPELSWEYGYVFAISLIAVAAWLPYKFFKHKGWL